MSEPGTVYLVGAGPGDPGLLTVRGLECLRQAEVVVYDYLANPALLAHAPAEAELVYVGKKAGAHTLKQEAINELLVNHGLAGRRVVRLKGGDPFVFGRGGEEALALREAGIPVEIVPGVTAGVAAPAYAGIPVTHRGYASALSLVTGHEDPNKDESAIDWEALARGGATLAFYMGVSNLPGIAQRLVAGGRSPETPVAVIRRGTFPDQEVVEGTLATIAARVAATGLRPPAITLVGDVVGLRRQLRWFDMKPLFGRTVVVTRSRTQSSELVRELGSLGARVMPFPTIRIEDVDDPGPLETAVASAGSFDWVAFTSTNAVDSVFSALERIGGDARALAGCRVCVTGSATAEALRAHGIRPDLIPPRFTSKAMFRALSESVDLRGLRFLLPRADIAPADLPDSLRAAGAEVSEVVAYRTVPARPEERVFDALRAGDVDVVTFTSSSTARNFAAIARRELGEIPGSVVYVSIGPETSKAAKSEGIAILAEAAEHTIAGLTATLVAEADRGTL